MRLPEIGRIEEARRWIVGSIEPEIDPGDLLLRVVPSAAEESDGTEGDAMPPFLPGQVLIEGVLVRRAAGECVARVPVGDEPETDRIAKRLIERLRPAAAVGLAKKIRSPREMPTLNSLTILVCERLTNSITGR